MATRRLRWLALLLTFTIAAAACGGETSDADPDEPESTTTTVADTDPDPGSDPDPETDPPAGDANIYQDRRGGIFQEFQDTFDRGDHPFTQVDSFCLPHEEAADRVATDEGITEDSINIGHIRTTLEDAEAFGMFAPVGDPKDMMEVFVNYINEECGGIRGRMLDLGYAEAGIIGDVDLERNAACLAMTEDHHSTIVLNVTGFSGTANLCIVEDQATPFISTQGQNAEYVEAGGDRLISVSLGLERSMSLMVEELIASGDLEGHNLGVIVQDTPGHLESVEIGLIEPLGDAGIDITLAVVQCDGSTICTANVPDVVADMVAAEVDVFFNVLGVFTAPGVISEMVNQGYEPGDIQFYATDFSSQAAELVASQIPGAGGDAAGALYNGAIVHNQRATGDIRDPEFVPYPFDEMCNTLYNENNTIGATHAWDDEGTSAYGMAAGVCGQLRLAARALYDAGENPTREDIENALINIGPWDIGAMLPASVSPGKTEAPDAIQTLDFSYPCDQPLPYENGGVSVCLTGRNDWRAVN